MGTLIGQLKEKDGDELTFKIKDIDEFNFTRLSELSDGGVPTAEIQFDDKRFISADQRKKTYAILNDISNHFGYYDIQFIKDEMKLLFFKKGIVDDWFSLSNCSMSVARDFISFLIEFCIENGVHLHTHPHKLTEDIDKYIYACLVNRVCCITGEPNADIHHCTGSRVQMGRDRQKVNHAKLELIPLNRYWHNRVHEQGEKEIFETFHIYGIKIKAKDLKKIGLKGEDIT